MWVSVLTQFSFRTSLGAQHPVERLRAGLTDHMPSAPTLLGARPSPVIQTSANSSPTPA